MKFIIALMQFIIALVVIWAIVIVVAVALCNALT